MGQRGPTPVPTHLLKLRGSWRGELNKGEPVPRPGRPKIPHTLSKDQAKVWRQLTAILDDMSLLTKADSSQLERYCVYFVRWRECESFIAKNGMTYPVKADEPTCYVGSLSSGEYVVGFAEYPQLKESHRRDHALKQIEASFGLTPAARSRITCGSGQTTTDTLKSKFFGDGKAEKTA